MAKLLGESSGIEFCQEPSKFLLAEKVIRLRPIATVNAKIWKELPNFLLLSSDIANVTELVAPKPTPLWPKIRYMDPIPKREKLRLQGILWETGLTG